MGNGSREENFYLGNFSGENQSEFFVSNFRKGNEEIRGQFFKKKLEKDLCLSKIFLQDF